MKSPTGIAIAALACGVAAAWLTWGLAKPGGAAAGPLVSVPVVVEALSRGEAITVDQAAALESVRVPRSLAPADVLVDAADAVDARPLIDLPPGAWLTGTVIAGGDQEATTGYRLREGERAITVDATVAPRDRQLAVGDRIDLLASGYGGDDRTRLEIAGAEVLETSGGDGGRTLATLRIAATQAPRVVRADVFAKDLRAVVVP